MKVKLPGPVCSAGVINIKPREMLIFGGWYKEDKSETIVLKENALDDFTIIGGNPLENEDTFLLSGVRGRNHKKREIIVFGKEWVHQYNEVDRTFRTL